MKNRNLIFILQILLIMSVFDVRAQGLTVSGTVTDENGEELPGVNILIKNSSTGVVTGIDGKYRISVKPADVLVFSYVGFVSEEILVGQQTTINLTLKPDVGELDEVVVIGYGTQRKSDITGSTGLLTSKDVDLQPVQRVENMLQGKVAGVTVAQKSGAPGATPKVNIRGFTGNPTYVIDGLIDADINSINPNDIQSISVLKDASATAIYGSRGANGVILITTKQGKTNTKLKTNVEYFHSISQLYNSLDLLDPISYMQLVNDKSIAAGGLERFTRAELLEAQLTPGFGTDWQDEIFRTAHTDNINVNVSKGWKKSALRLSIGARNDQGIIENSNYQRYTARLNFNTSLTAKTKLRIDGSYAQEQTNNVGDRSDGANRIVQAATAWSPNLPVIDPVTGDYSIFQGYGPTVLENPGYLINEIDGKGKRNVYNANISVTQQLLEGLSVKAAAALQFTNSNGSTFRRFEPGQVDDVTTISSSESEGFHNQWNLQFDYKKKFGQDHNLSMMVVGEVLDRESETFRFDNIFSADGIPGETLPDPNDPFDFTSLGQISYLGRVNYDYKGKLLFTGSFRSDASSRLPADNQWDNFFSAALAYQLAEEPFINSISWIQDLKLRAGYGEVGNVNSVGFAQIQSLVNPDGSGYVFQDNNVRDVVKFEDGGSRANPDLIWESSRTFNAGIDLALFEGKIEFVADYYVKLTEDALFDQPVPAFLGGGSFKDNAGRFQNSGVELTLIHQLQTSSDFKIRSSINFTLNQSEVLEIPQDTLFRGARQNGFDQQSHILVAGQQIGQLWGYRYLGAKVAGADRMEGEINGLQEGEAIYFDRNGDGQISVDDMVSLGNGHPDFTWGFNSHISYKNFSLNIFIQGVHGTDAFNLPQHGLLGGGGGILNATSTEILNSATYGGNLPSLTANFRAQSSLFVEDASFVRLRNITLGYDIPQNFSKKLKMSSLRIYAGVQNLITLTKYTGYDPESKSGGNFNPGIDRGSFPIPSTYTFGLNLSF